jgi:hypothetical protein
MITGIIPISHPGLFLPLPAPALSTIVHYMLFIILRVCDLRPVSAAREALSPQAPTPAVHITQHTVYCTLYCLYSTHSTWRRVCGLCGVWPQQHMQHAQVAGGAIVIRTGNTYPGVFLHISIAIDTPIASALKTCPV